MMPSTSRNGIRTASVCWFLILLTAPAGGARRPCHQIDNVAEVRAMNTVLDSDRVQAFAEQALGIVNGGCLSLMLSVGHRTGLFDTLATLAPATSEEIATAAGLNERYVREWLGAMVTGRIVEFNPEARTYWLPREHAAALTRAAGPDNLAELAQIVSMLGQVESAIVDVFRKGGGVGYEAFERFHALMAESSRTTLEATLLTRTLPLVPGLADRLEAGIDVLDVGCGEGVAIRMLAARFPRSRFTGIDIGSDAIATASNHAAAAGLANASFIVQDAAAFSAPAAFDFITAFDAIHDQAAPRRVLRSIREALRPDGVFLMVDIAASSHLERNLDNPLAPFLFTVSTMHCMTVSLAQGGEGLGACWGEEKARELLSEAGFSSIDVTSVEGDPLNIHYLARP
jgi:2-polyprenyl-3-methyl-5-hydroxy-6-metoxy-1,4-benzoquinol methylase